MLEKLSIRKKLIISILLGCLLPYLIGSLYMRDKQEEWLYDNNVKHANVLLRQTAEQVDSSVLKLTQSLISMIVMDERITNVDPGINSYVNFGTKDFELHTTKCESEIMSFFRSIKETHGIITFVSFGTENGGYIEYPAFNPKAPYDPRVRGWYMNAISQDKAVISEPYVTNVTKDLVISVDKSVVSKGRKIGVISLTIGLDNIMKNIDQLNYGKTGCIYILSPSNVFINSHNKDEWLMNSVENLKLKVFESIDKYNGKSFEGQIDSVDKVFNVYISPYSGWKYISVIDKSEVLEQSRDLSDLLLFIYIATFFIILALIFFISNYISKPILNIAQVINKMATFNFDFYEHKDFETYTYQKNEIGEISRALNRMQENFIELKNKISIMDEEIQNIDINEKYIYQLNLSEDNPFAGITNSVNGLLKKVYSYIEQIRLFNDEISNKNELLAASEEELIARLQEINTKNEKILYLAEHDPLTNLPNRRSFREKLNSMLINGMTGAVLLLDLDNFKSINDTLGHFFGDKVLQHISFRLEQLSAHSIFVARLGGDEFLILFEYKKDINELLRFIEQLFGMFRKPFHIDENEVKLEFSMGISVFPKDSCSIDQLIMNADLALYFIKNSGKNNYAFFNNTMAERLKSKLDTKNVLTDAIENNGFKMVYQPQVDIQSGEVIGFEALIRLKNHNLTPKDFIGVAEENGLIVPIGRIVTRIVVEQISTWKQKGFKPKPVAINFSAIQIHDEDYKTYLFELLDEYNVSPDLIIIEITENIFLENTESTIVFLNELREHGIKIAVDDFGTGYSSLSYLTFLPIDTLKLDRELSIKFLEHNNTAVMDSLIGLAHSLKLKVIAEGIENYTQVERLVSGKCDAIQGYYFSEPLEVEDAEDSYDRVFIV